MFFAWKIHLEKVQLTRDIKGDTIIYQGIRLPCKNDQSFCYPTTKTQANFVWFPEDTCNTFQVAKIHARTMKFRQKTSLNQPLMTKYTLIKSNKKQIVITISKE